MVVQIANSDSCNTLVSLDGLHKEAASCDVRAIEFENRTYRDFRQTELCLPADDFGFDYDESDFGVSRQAAPQKLYIPTEVRVDHHMLNVPELRDACDQLLAVEPRCFDSTSSEKVLAVAQREVAHATPMQCDVIMSDKATTCHILALHSTSSRSVPLASMAHLDGTGYEKCVRSMVTEHINHHQDAYDDEEKKWDDSGDERIDIAVHILGGFEDDRGYSLETTSWLMGMLADIAEDEIASAKITLKTCAVSCMNDNGFACPIGRGLGMNVRSGDVFLAAAADDVCPASVLRSARLWSHEEGMKLNVIHSHECNDIRIEAFDYKVSPDVVRLLALPDSFLLQLTSTSPDVEEAGFCSSLRSTIRLMRDVKPTKVFGPQLDRTLVFRRAGNSNTWKRLR